MGFPCVGSWVTYGLGSESQNLPAFCVMYDTLGRGMPKGHAQNWGAGFLPSVFQGTAFKPQGEPIDNLTRPADLTRRAAARAARPAREAQQEGHGASTPGEPDLAARVETFELAYRMQMAAPEALDVTKETDETQEALRPRQPEGDALRQAVPDRPAAGRTRRALRADLLAAAWRTS